MEGKHRHLFVHRKGATRAYGPGHPDLPDTFRDTGQPVLIGGSMGTASYILAGNRENETLSFSPACHGAGRSMSRRKASKTWRGLVAALLACAVAGPLMGFSLGFSLLFAALAMAGDLLSSFIKRRCALEPSDQFLGVDQIPEAFLPCIFAVIVTGLQWWWAILLPLLFAVLELLVSGPLYKLKIRKRPY